MARSLSQALTRLSSLSVSRSTPQSSRLLQLRHRSSSPEEETTAAERVALKNLEEAIHKIIVKRSQPNWIQLVPGASYWVPPKSKVQGLAQVIGKLVYNNNNNNSTTTLMKDKDISLSSDRGWPSSAQFFKGASHSPLEGETTPKSTSQSEEEEG